MSRIYNFYSGPSTLPLTALEEVSAKLVDFEGAGMSLIEMSHRGREYDRIHNETIALFREILKVPDGFHVVFLQGGATMLFGLVPMALIPRGGHADFILTGHWGVRAHEDASTIADARIAWDGKGDGFRRMPARGEIALSGGAAYVHLCSNETIGGIQWSEFPDTGGVPLVADMSSDIMSRPLDWDRFAMVFAGTQKNLAPAGMTVMVVRDDFARTARRDLPSYFRLDLHIDNNSLFNTPPTFVVWMMNLTLRWIKSIGGMAEVERRRDAKAGLVYSAIDASGGFYTSPVDASSRSKMNVVWHLHDAALLDPFLKEAEKAGLAGLKGHRSVGGLRASIYNAMPVEGVKALADFMNHFRERHG